MFFSDWAGLLRMLLVGVMAYFSLILRLRLFGKRTLSKLNAFDLVVTVALGSTLASVLLSKDVPLAEGVLALGLLIFLQFVITWSSLRVPWLRGLVKAEPVLQLRRGEFLWPAMKAERVTEEEVRQAVRAEGITSLTEVAAVVLETDGSFSVLQEFSTETTSSLANVRNLP